MPQTIALEAQSPLVDVPGILNNAQQSALRDQSIQQGANNVQKSNLELQQAGNVNTEQNQRFQAMQDYHKAVANGDQAAAEKAVQAFPDLHDTYTKANAGLTPQQQDENMQHTADIAASAQKVLSLPDGSPEQKALFTSEINGLLQKGSIDKASGDALLAAGPSRQLLQRAMTALEYAKSFGGSAGMMAGLNMAKTQSEISKNNATADYMTNPKTKLANARANQIIDPYGLNADGNVDPTKPSDIPETNAEPVAPATQADFDALPSGTLYVNPADGQTYKKN